MIQALPDSAVHLAEMESALQELKRLVLSWGWTYAVIWKIGSDHRTPVWLQSYLNETAGAEVGPAQRFESIFRQCQFTPTRPGYAYLAWQRQKPLWWTRYMEPVLTDEGKELFLTQAGIQTLVCFPGRAIADGTGYCVELGCTELVSETEILRTSIQEFLNTSIDPYLSTTSSSSFLQQEAAGALRGIGGGPAPSTTLPVSAAMAVLAHQTSAILTDITSQASMGEVEAIDGFGNIVRPEEPYSSWTTSSQSSWTTSWTTGFPSLQPFGDLSAHYPNFQESLGVNYGDSPLLDPFRHAEAATMLTRTQPLSSRASEWTPNTGSGSISKGKEVLEEQSDRSIPRQHLSSLQREALEKLRSPPSALVSSKTVPSALYRSMRPVGQILPLWHDSSRSLFRPHRHVSQVPRFVPPGVSKKKRQPLIQKWVTSLAPRIPRLPQPQIAAAAAAAAAGGDPLRAGGAGSSFHGSPAGPDPFDPRSPNSVAHDHHQAVAHKHAERKRREKFTQKLQTLIAIVPMTNKKKDKVSVLSSTIDYIRQLNSRISSLKRVEEAAPSTSRMEGGATTALDANMDREEEPTMLNSTGNTEGAGPSSASAAAATQGPPVVVVEGSPGDDNLVIKVEACNRTRSLIQLLNVLLELELGVVNVDYYCLNGRFRACISVKNSRILSTSSSELEAMIFRVLVETGDSPLTGSD